MLGATTTENSSNFAIENVQRFPGRSSASFAKGSSGPSVVATRNLVAADLGHFRLSVDDDDLVPLSLKRHFESMR